MSRTLIIFGLVLPVAGVAWPSIDRLGLGGYPATSQSSGRTVEEGAPQTEHRIFRFQNVAANR